MRFSTVTAWSSAVADRATGRAASAGTAPNDLWCADFKGELKLSNGCYCYPLTATDHASRLLLMCEALESTREETAFTAFERLESAGCPAADVCHPEGFPDWQATPPRPPSRASTATPLRARRCEQ